MRTILTLDLDVARLLKMEVKRNGKPFKQVMNEAIRRGLAVPDKSRSGRHPDGGTPMASLPRGTDNAAFSRLLDELDSVIMIADVAKP